MPSQIPRPFRLINRRSSIRRSTDEDIKFIHAWLIEQSSREIAGSFLCNWNLTERSHFEGGLLVYIDGPSGMPVAYQWGGLIQPGILEVRYDMRGRGIGRRLVERRISEVYKKDECLLFIQCKPSTSIPFWSRMGFTLLDRDNGENNAYRILEKSHQLPLEAQPVSVVIRFYPNSRKWCDSTPPIVSATPQAVRTTDNIVHLKDRVFFFERIYSGLRETVVEIIVDGDVLLCDRARDDEAAQLGMRRCTNGFYIDRVLL